MPKVKGNTGVKRKAQSESDEVQPKIHRTRAQVKKQKSSEQVQPKSENSLKARTQSDSDDIEFNDSEGDKLLKKKKKLRKVAGSVSISVAVTMFYKNQIDQQKPRTIKGQERAAKCKWCNKVFVAWEVPSKNRLVPGFDSKLVVQHLKNCENDEKEENPAWQQHVDFKKSGSCDLNILWPTSHNRPFFSVNCSLCHKLVFVSANEPKAKDNIGKAQREHLKQCKFLNEVQSKFFSGAYANNELNSRFEDAKMYEDCDDLNDKRPVFYAFCNKLAKVRDIKSFFEQLFKYFGQSKLGFAARIMGHGGTNKNFENVNKIPIAFGSTEDVAKLELVAIWIFYGKVKLENSDKPSTLLADMTPKEFDEIASSLYILLSNFYDDYVAKNPIELVQQQHEESVFKNARDEFMTNSSEAKLKLLESTPHILLSPDVLTIATSNKDIQATLKTLMRQINQVKRVVQPAPSTTAKRPSKKQEEDSKPEEEEALDTPHKQQVKRVVQPAPSTTAKRPSKKQEEDSESEEEALVTSHKQPAKRSTRPMPPPAKKRPSKKQEDDSESEDEEALDTPHKQSAKRSTQSAPLTAIKRLSKKQKDDSESEDEEISDGDTEFFDGNLDSSFAKFKAKRSKHS